jgi:hypothetical protein
MLLAAAAGFPGAGPASLYARVASRDELTELMIDRIADEIEVPGPDPEHSRDQLPGIRPARPAGVGRSRRHRPHLAGHDPHRTRPPARDRGLLAIMRAAGISDELAAWGADRLQPCIGADTYEL